MRDETIHFVKCEGQKNLFCKINRIYYVHIKSNRDLLHAICIVQTKSNRYIH